jgi:hypothetical protein
MRWRRPLPNNKRTFQAATLQPAFFRRSNIVRADNAMGMGGAGKVA